MLADKLFAVRSSPAAVGAFPLYQWGIPALPGGTNAPDPYYLSPTALGTSWRSALARRGGNILIDNDYNLYLQGMDLFFPYIAPSRSWSAIGVGASTGYGITADGKLYGWGGNPNGLLANLRTAIARSSPVLLGPSSASFSWTSITSDRRGATSMYTLAIRSDGTLWGWGSSQYGTLVDTSLVGTNFSSPIQIGTSSWAQVSAGTLAALAIRQDGTLWGWGANALGQLGQAPAAEDYSWTMIAADGLSTVSRCSVLGIRNDGTLWGWGTNSHGQLGLNNTTPQYSPVQIGTSSWSFVTMNLGVVAAIRSDGTLWMWGDTAGANGLHDIVHRSSPVQVGTISNWKEIRIVGDNNQALGTAVAVRTTGELYTWGYGLLGILGNNTTGTNVSTPTRIGTSSWTTVSAGYAHIAAIRSDGALFTWGGNFFGELGETTGSTNDRWTDIAPVPGGVSHQAAIRSDGGLFTWGLNNSGQLGQNNTTDRSSPVQVGTSSWTAVAVGIGYTLAVRSDGALFTWGSNTNGQLGQNDLINRSSPVQVGTSSWTSVAATDASFAIRSDGALFVWGSNGSGQLGQNDLIPRSSPVQVGTDSWSTISVNSNVVAIRSDGALFTWGDNTNGVHGLGDVIPRSSPVQIGTSSWTAVAVGQAVAAVRSDGTLWGWGASVPSLETPFTHRSSPVIVAPLSWTSVAAGSNSGSGTIHAIRSDGTLWGGGFNTWGQLGDGSVVDRSWRQIGDFTWSKVRGGRGTTFAIKDQELWVWGLNQQSQLGLSQSGFGFDRSSPVQLAALPAAVTNRSSPVQIGIKSWSAISASRNHNLAIRSDGRVFAWGRASDTFTSWTTYPEITEVQYKWNKISVDACAIAIREDNTLWAWGQNALGQLGDNTVTLRSSPVQIGMSSWTQISGGLSHTAAIRSDGALFMWGGNGAGQLGLNDRAHRSSPIQIGTSSWTAVFAAGSLQTTMAIRSDGALFTWGAGGQGQLGQSDTISRSSPVQVGTSSWSQLPTGQGNMLHVGAIRSDGALFMWGNSSAGQLGQNNLISYSSPVQVGTLSSWTSVTVFNNTTAAIRSDGAIFAWGEGAAGQTGQNNAINRSSPVQVGTSSWSQIGGGYNSVIARRIDDTLWGWGSDVNVQLAQGGNAATPGGGVGRSSPVFIASTNSTWSTFDVGSAVGGIAKNGSLWLWGSGTTGVLGDKQINTTFGLPSILGGQIAGLAYANVHRSSPVMIALPGTSWTKVFTLPFGGAAIRSDGALWMWGSSTGRLDRNPLSQTVGAENLPVPVQIGVGSWAQVAAVPLTTGDGQTFTATYLINSAGKAFFAYPGLANRSQLFGGGRFDSNNAQFRTYGIQPLGQILGTWSPIQIGTSSWSSVSVGDRHVHAIRSDGTLWAWGGIRNIYTGTGLTLTYAREEEGGVGGFLGVSTETGSKSPIQVSTSSWSKVAAGWTHVAAIRSDGALFTWGWNDYGQIGDNNMVHRSSPVQVGTSSWTTVDVGLQHTLAIRNDGSLWSWGGNTNGQLGITSGAPMSWTFIDGGAAITSAIRKDGGLFVWGQNNAVGILGLNDTAHRSSPTQVGTSSWTMTSVGFSHAAAIRSDGALFMWGQNTSGQLGQNDAIHRSSPVQVGTSSWTTVSVAGQTSLYTAAIRSDGALFMWGNNGSGQLGQNDRTHRSSPIQIGTSSWTQVQCDLNGTVAAIRSDGALFVWGDNTRGQHGQNDSGVSRSSPIQVGTSSWTSVRVNAGVVFAIRSDGTLWGWGINTNGVLGINESANHRSSPVQISAQSWSQVLKATDSSYTAFAIRNDGSLWGWGTNNTSYPFDPVITASRSSPVQLSTTITWSWTQIAQAGSSYFAIRQDGTLWGWGSNGAAGPLGVNDGATVTYSSPVQLGANGILIHRSSPTQVTAMASWSSIAAGQLWNLAVASDATLWGWGNQLATINNLGIEEAGNRSAPTQIGNRLYTAAESPIQVGAAKYIMAERNSVHYAAIRLDGTLWTWGRSDNGRTGLNDVIHRSSPTQVGLSTWSTLAIGQGHMAAIRSDGTLWAWGTNLTGQLGEQQGVTYSWTSISTSLAQQFAIRSDGTLWAWGNNGSGELGQNDLVHRSSPVQIGTSSWTAVAGTQGSTGSGLPVFAIRIDGALFAWGNNNNGALGLNDRVHRSSPVQIGTSSWTSIASGYVGTVAAIRSDGALFTWGPNDFGQLGQNDIAYRSSPTQVGTSSWTVVTASQNHTAAIRSDSTLWAWGNNNNGQLGQNDLVSRSSPVQIGTGSWKAVDAGLSFTAAIRSDDTLWTWGNNSNGQLGEVVGTVQSWSVVAASGGINGGSAAIRSDGALFCWGINTNGAVGDNTIISRSSPVQIGTSSWTQISLWGFNRTALAIRSDGALFAWGSNTDGLLGQSDVISRSSPVQIGTSSWTQVSVKQDMALAIRSDGGLFIWGRNQFGVWGNNTADTFAWRSSPVQLGTSSWTSIGGSGFSLFAVRTDGTLWAWGENAGGGLGLGDRNHRSSPVQIGTDTNWLRVSQGGHFAIKTNGTVWGWGWNGEGQLGQNDTAHRSSPVQIAGSWTMVERGIGQRANPVPMLGIKTDGTLWAWGSNSRGTAGQNDIINRSSPVQIPGSWTSVGVGDSHVGAIRSDGRLFMWGFDGGNFATSGNLGDSNFTGFFGAFGVRSSPVIVGPHIAVGLIHRSSPVQVGVGDPGTWSRIAAAAQTLIAISTTNKLFTWGLGNAGILAQGDANISRSSPVQVGLSSWSQVSAGDLNGSAIRSDNTLWTWGFNTTGIIGTNETISRSSPILVGTLNPTIDRSSPVQVGNSADTWKTVACGGSHTIAIKSDNTLWGWGDNTAGQLGVGDRNHRSSPTQISSSAWTAIGVGISHTIALRSDGTLWSIGGTNTSGELGLTRGSLFSWTSIAGGQTATAAIRSDGTLWVWGSGTWGIPGQDDTIARSSPVQVAGSWSTVDISVSHALAIRSDGALFAWGGNANGELGQNDVGIARSSPVQIGTSSWTKVFAGVNLSAAIRSDGRLFMWGFNTGGNIGDGTTVHRSSPVQVGTSSWAMISTAKSNWTGQSASQGRHVIAIRSDGTLWGWGDNFTYGLGRPLGGQTPDYRSSPVQIGSESSWTQISTNGAWHFAVDSSNRLWGWGSQLRGPNGSGIVGGQSSASDLEVSINVLDTTSPVVYSWSTIAAGYDNVTAAIRSDGSLWTWGYNILGQLGVGDRNHRSSPVQVGTSSWTAVVAGQNVMLAIRSDGALFAWGQGSAAGLNDLVARSSPVQVGTSSWTAISIASQHVLAIRSDGSLFAWGAGTFGALGNNSQNSQSSPVQIGTSSWTAVNAGWTTSSAIRSDGALFMWGSNDYGQLGQNDLAPRSSPVQVGTSSWSFVSTSLQTTGAIRSDNSLFMWGRNSIGALGQGDTVHRSSPVQVPGKSVKLLVLANSSVSGDPSVLFTTQEDRLWFMGSGYEGKNWIGQQNATSPVLLNSVNNTSLSGLRGRDYNLFRVPKAFSVSNGGTHVGTITDDNLLFIWGGGNTNGHFGVNYISTYFFQNTPVLIGGPQRNFHLPVFLRSNVVQVVAEAGPISSGAPSPDQVLMVKTTTGIVEGLGYNVYGSMGRSDRVHRSTFTQIGGSSWTTIANAGQICAIAPDGLLYLWGNLSNGGIDSVQSRSSPTIVGMLPTPGVGGLAVSRSSPVQIGLDRSWVLLNTGDQSTFAVDSQYTLWGWGFNAFRLDQDFGGGHRSSPVQVSTLKSWVAVSAELNLINVTGHINGLLKS